MTDASWIPVAALAASVLGVFVGWLAAGRRRERALEEARTVELSRLREGLDVARARAAAAEQATKQVLANLSHELRTPLGGILGFTDLLADGALEPPQRRALEMVRSSGERLLTVVDDLLDLSRLESQAVEFQVEDIDLRELCESVACLLASQAQDKGLELVCNLAFDSVRTLRGDPRRLRQVLINLTSNAIKFTDVGEIEIFAETLLDQADGPQLSILVRDTGVGMDEETIASIFHPFRVGDGSDRRRHRGLGLGLALSNRLVNLMGGRIQVASTPGGGSMFRVLLPLPSGEVDQGEPTGDPCPVREVLLVVGNRAMRRSLGQSLRSLGVIVREAGSTEEAIGVLDGSGYVDLVLFDRGGESGGWRREVDALRAHPRATHAPVAVLVPRAEASVPRSAPAEGLSLLPKPPRREELERCLAWAAGLQDLALFEPPPERRRAVGTGAAPDSDQNALRILLVEDNPINQRLEGAFLVKAGFHFELAENGLEAVQAVDRARFDLILMDVQMPIMDGLEATRVIRERESRGRHTPIIAVTARALAGDRETCLAAGMDDYLSKPLNFERLVDAIRTWTGDTEGEARGAWSGVG